MNDLKEISKKIQELKTTCNPEEIVVHRLTKLYAKQRILNITHLPHYSYWNRSHYGVKMPIFRKLTDNWADKKYVERLEKAMDELKKYGPSTKNKNTQAEEIEANMDRLQREYAKEKYSEAFGLLNKGKTFEDYCHTINELMSESREYFFYDLHSTNEYNQCNNKKQKIRLYYKENTVKHADTKKPCTWFSNCMHQYIVQTTSKREEASFSVYAKKLVSQFEFKKEFPMEVENYELILNDAYLEIQLEMLYNPQLRNLFKTRQYKSMKSEGISMYSIDSISERLNPIFKDITDDSTHRKYVYVIEKFTGINLAATFSKYYTLIMQSNNGNISKNNLQNLLLEILDEFIDMPNLYSRIAILKEYMEPVLFWDGNIRKKLECIGEELSLLREKHNAIINEIQTNMHINELIEQPEYEKIDFKITQAIKTNKSNHLPFLFIEDYDMFECCIEHFAIVCKHIIARIVANYNIVE